MATVEKEREEVEKKCIDELSTQSNWVVFIGIIVVIFPVMWPLFVWVIVGVIVVRLRMIEHALKRANALREGDT